MKRVTNWSEEVRLRLFLWFRWVNKHHLYEISGNPIAAMIKRAAGELPGDDLDVPLGLTLELEVTEKAVARMREAYPVPRRLLIETYVHGRFIHEIAADRNWSEKKTKMELWRAESVVGRYMIDVEKELTQDVAFSGKVAQNR